MTLSRSGGEEWREMEKARDRYHAEALRPLVASARDNIPRIRQRDVTLRLLDRRGHPVAQREVEVVQTDSDFAWGFCGWAIVNQVTNGTFDHPASQRARRWATDLYNAVNLMLYWTEKHAPDAPMSEELQGHPRYDDLERAAEWAVASGLRAKGHPLFWPTPKAIPEWLDRYDAATRMKFLEVRIRTLAARMRGKLTMYDAVNEMVWEPAFRNTAQRHWPHVEDLDAVADDAEAVLRWAREEDPDAVYLLNEYGIDHGSHEPIPVPTQTGGSISRHEQLERYLTLIRRLQDRGAPPDAVGFQTPHGDWGCLDRVVRTYDALGERTGLPVHVTEFRPGTEHLKKAGLPEADIQALLADYLEDFLTCAFGNRHLEAFFFWGEPHFYGAHEPTKVYHRVRRLLRETWRTRLTARTDGQGTLQFRGFTGRYVLRLTHASGQRTGRAFAVPASSGGVAQDLRCDACA
jgi:GH35 family endo-1,4-beta-xylanase